MVISPAYASDVYINQVEKTHLKSPKIQQIPSNKRPFVQKKARFNNKNVNSKQKKVRNFQSAKQTVKVFTLPYVRGGATLDLSKKLENDRIIVLPSVRGGAIRLPANQTQ